MSTTKYIPTPTGMNLYYRENSYYLDSEPWINRARKLRARRWRKIANRLASSESHDQLMGTT